MYTIVVADDEEDLRRTIIRKIDWESIGFQVVGEAENGVEALELVTKNEPDLLLTDIRMPFISGLELARQVREVRPSTQIAFLSGYDDFSYAQEAIRYNIISYLLKPISLEELSENLRQIKEKLDRIFSEFSERRRTGPDVAEFLLPLLLDGSQTEASGDREEREARLMEQAVACRFLEPVHSNIHYVVISVSLWTGRSVTAPATGMFTPSTAFCGNISRARPSSWRTRSPRCWRRRPPPWTNTCTLLSTRSCRASSVFWDFTATSGRAA